MKRHLWLDFSRAIACILVAIGHLLMSFEAAGIVEKNMFITFALQVFYHFHVYVFFFCSGYLFQENFVKYTDIQKNIKAKIIRVIDFIVPYVIFSFLTYYIKMVLANNVNSIVEDSFTNILFKQPINQMWYLYAISLIIVVTPVIKNMKLYYVVLAIGIGLKLITFLPEYKILIPVDYLFQNLIWFVLGMVWSYKNIILNKWKQTLIATIFIVLNVFEFLFGINSRILDGVVTLSGVLAFIEIVRRLTKGKEILPLIWKLFVKYMFQIYLLHTICAAGIRIILLKLDIQNIIVHMILGIIFSFIVPIVCAMITERNKFLNIVFFPSKTIKSIMKKST